MLNISVVQLHISLLARAQQTMARPMSINVETIGDALVVQHYIAEVREPHFCRMVSISDSISPTGRTKLQVVWELSAKRIDDQTCGVHEPRSFNSNRSNTGFLQGA